MNLEEKCMSEQPKRLYRSRTNKVFAGICGGFAEYLNLDPTVVRVLWIFLTLFGGSGILLYIIAYFIMPRNPYQYPAPNEPPSASSAQAGGIIGAILIFVGMVILLDNLDLFHFHRWMRVSWEFLLPLMLIAGGVYLLMRRQTEAPATPAAGAGSSEPGGGSAPSGQGPSEPAKRLERSLMDRKFLGVCGGLGRYLAIDSTIIRILFVMFVLMSFGFGFVLYFVLFLIMPEERLAIP